MLKSAMTKFTTTERINVISLLDETSKHNFLHFHVETQYDHSLQIQNMISLHKNSAEI